MTSKYSGFLFSLSILVLTACGSTKHGTSSAASSNAVVSGALVATASSYTIAPYASSTLSVIGGTAPYTWTVSSGGTVNTNTGTSVVFTAGASTGTGIINVSDSAGNSTSVIITISTSTSTSVSGNVCSGSYAATLGSYTGTFIFATGSSGALTGYLTYAGHTYPLTGTCTTSAISFTLTETGDAFSGTFVANSSSRSSMTGTFYNVYLAKYMSWTAVPQ